MKVKLSMENFTFAGHGQISSTSYVDMCLFTQDYTVSLLRSNKNRKAD